MKKALAEDIVQSESGSFANSRGESKPARQAGDVSRYLIGLRGGFRRRISARELCSLEYSAMFSLARVAVASASASRCRDPLPVPARWASPGRRGARWAN